VPAAVLHKVLSFSTESPSDDTSPTFTYSERVASADEGATEAIIAAAAAAASMNPDDRAELGRAAVMPLEGEAGRRYKHE
jgi:hypothetical protein